MGKAISAEGLDWQGSHMPPSFPVQKRRKAHIHSTDQTITTAVIRIFNMQINTFPTQVSELYII